MEFPSYIYSESFLSATTLDDLVSRLDIDSKKDKESHVYNQKEKVNTVNKHLRSSRKVEYRDVSLFDWVDAHIVTPLNDSSEYHFVLVRNDLEVVKYAPGDFFRKHQDYVNFDSNVYRNYTFLLNLVPCQKGGETLIYERDSSGNEEITVIDGTAHHPGSLLAFQKETIHEGREVLEGNKVILKGNLLGFQKGKSVNTEDYVIVELAKEPNHPYVIPVSRLGICPTSMYATFYSFEKKQHPDQHIFFLRDEVLAPMQFAKFYESISTEEKLAGLYKSMDYVGLNTNNSAIGSIASFMKNPDRVMLCSMRDYYEFLGVCNAQKLIPFQMITLETKDSSTIAWFGIDNNRLVTCDYFVNGVSAGGYYYSDDEEGAEYENREIDQEHHQRRIERALDFNTLTYNSGNIIPEHRWRDLIVEPCPETQKQIRSYLWKEYGLQSMAETLNLTSGDGHSEMIEFIQKIVTEISRRQTNDSGDGSYRIDGKINRFGIKDQLTKYTSGKPGPGQDRDKTLNVEAMIDEIRKLDVTSSLSRASMSEFFCNETYYVTYDIVCRFGLMKV